MKQIIKIIPLFISFILYSSLIYSQNSTNSSWGEINDTSATVSYSVGQVFTETKAISGVGFITEGVQQAYEIFTVGIGADSINASLLIKSYPNPVKELLILELEEAQNNIGFSLYDINGKLIEQQDNIKNKTIINLMELASGTYILKVYSETKQLKTFKIIKN